MEPEVKAALDQIETITAGVENIIYRQDEHEAALDKILTSETRARFGGGGGGGSWIGEGNGNRVLRWFTTRWEGGSGGCG